VYEESKADWLAYDTSVQKLAASDNKNVDVV